MKDAVYSFAILVFGLFVYVAIIAFEKWHEYSQSKKMKDLVAWSLTGGDGIPLWAELSNAQINLHIPQEYCISGDQEWSLVKGILEEYKKHLTLSYFQGQLGLIKSKYVINGEAYFMFTLQDFLREHQCDYNFLGHNMHKETLEYKRYGDWGGPCYDATYSLTDFAIVFHKMYYIAYLFCKNNKAINPSEDAFQNEKIISEIIDTKQIQLSAGS